MDLANVHLINFRLFEEVTYDISGKGAIVLGKNGTGKTSFLESINIALSGKSHRTKNLKECINEGSDFFQIGINGKSGIKKSSIKVTKGFSSRISRSTKIEDTTAQREYFPVPVFVLSINLRMIEGEPELRRDFFNQNMFHVKHNSREILKKYQKTLFQRNKALKGNRSESEIKIWTEKLIETGMEVNKAHRSFFKQFQEHVGISLREKAKGDLSNFFNEITFAFNQGWPADKDLGHYMMTSYEKDKVLGYTSNGPHRMDLRINFKNKQAKSVLSRGQQKLLILFMFFLLEKLIIRENKQGIVYLLDDIASEMDEKNIVRILNKIETLESKVILTALDMEFLKNNSDFLNKYKQIKL